MSLLAIVVLLYLTLILGLSVYSATRIKNEEDYIVAGRRLPLWLAWGTLLATWFGAATILGAAEAARDEGVRGTILDPFASGISLIVAGLFFAKPLWEMKLLTVGDFFARRYGSKAELVSSVILVPGYCGWIAAQYVALAQLQQLFFGIPLANGIFFAATLVLVYTMIGGMWSVTITDTLQVVIALGTLVVLGLATFSHLGGGSASEGVSRLFQETPADALNFLPEPGLLAGFAWMGVFATGVLGNIPGQDLLQRVFASRDSTTAKRACILAGVAYLGFGLLPVGMGLASRLMHPDETSKGILGILAQEYLSPKMTVLFVISLTSMIISTCTSAVLSPATVLGHNLLGRIPRLKDRRLFLGRLSVFLITLASIATAFGGESILGLLELSLSIILVSLFVPLTFGIYGKPRGELAGMLAMIFGAVTWAFSEFLQAIIAAGGEESEASSAFMQSIAGTLGELPAFIQNYAVISSAITGTTASLLGYFLGQFLLKKRTP